MLSEEKKTHIETQSLGVLKRFFGYDSFRPQQQEIITAVCSGRDCEVLMPTGGGKSICYQVPALVLPGVCIVVSPLIALMNDQVMNLQSCGIPAASLHSNQTEAENIEIIHRLMRSEVKILYVSPERLMLEIENWVGKIDVSLFAIDEAHCISQWGHDFRPEYTQLHRIKELFPSVPVIALTATADKLTRADIIEQLRLKNPAVFISSFDRPNLYLSVRQSPQKAKKLNQICEIIDRYPDDCGIIYCISRKSTEQMAADLTERGYSVGMYHAGLGAAVRSRAQEDFIHGRIQVMVATLAFGMGIDKSNIRYVIHNNMPRNIEGYYQEIGRAGRDGLPAETVMFYSFSDVATLKHFIAEGEREQVNMEKLTRMIDYAESGVCRRRVLLSYFSEPCDSDCGHCDNCINPPQRIDGTIIAQKALSAILRTGEQVGVYLLIDILRGSAKAEIITKGYDRLKTYGAGRDLDSPAWRAYLSQMLQIGLIEVAYDDGNKLKITEAGRDVVFGKQKVTFSKFFPEQHKKSSKTKDNPKKRAEGNVDDKLFQELRRLRADMAKIQSVPAFVIFDNKTLTDMCIKRPKTREQFLEVNGVGEMKAERYWTHFTRLIRQFEEKN